MLLAVVSTLKRASEALEAAALNGDDASLEPVDAEVARQQKVQCVGYKQCDTIGSGACKRDVIQHGAWMARAREVSLFMQRLDSPAMLTRLNGLLKSLGYGSGSVHPSHNVPHTRHCSTQEDARLGLALRCLASKVATGRPWSTRRM